MKKRPTEKNAGLVVGNSTLAADVSPKGRLFQRIKFNPPSFNFGECAIRSAGDSGFSFCTVGTEKEDFELEWRVAEHTFPRYVAAADLTDSIGLRVEAYAPISTDNVRDMFLPAIVVHVLLENKSNASADCSVCAEWHCEEAVFGSDTPILKEISDCSFAAEKGKAYISVYNAERVRLCSEDENILSISGTVNLAPREAKEITFRLGCLFPSHRITFYYRSIEDLVSGMDADIEKYRDGIQDFIDSVPSIGDEKITEYTRWYMQAAIMLTKSTNTGEVITMGYTELNQRDSFWTSFVHLSIWPELERDMIEVSCRWQRTDGKIPTTVLPMYERNFDIDINEYFCLRIARYYDFHNDRQFLSQCWDYYKNAVKWLLTRDLDGDGIPDQDVPENPECFWGDWKDVSGIVGRKLAPHFALLWLAVLKEGKKLAAVLGDTDTAELYGNLFKRAYTKINADFDDGGMWLDDRYTEVWYDGRKVTQVLQDQVVGLIYGVVPDDRVELIYKALSRGENDIGIPETYPYRENFGYDPWMYHNGGIWPYLTFCDCLSRFKNGRPDDAERLIKKIGYYDLEKDGEYSPNEYLHGQTGENCGFEVQGWSSALYGAVTHGAFGIKHIDDSTVEIEIRFPDRDFETVLFLPLGYGKIKLSRKGGQITVEKLTKNELNIQIKEV